ncbi:DUF3866 family protein [Sanguibacter sp. A247]|uniref:DUF3866 family protein n=1 Tax=unclassified Sanguibacter TaxID=2645534 RepID=UPI003FD84D9A
MMSWRDGVVVSLGRSWPGACEATVRTASGGEVRALAYPDLVGMPRVGDAVLLNATALERGLGTGGYALIVALPDALPADAPAGPGHLVKARYTPLQTMVLGVDEQDSEHHATLRDADDLAGLPVVVADLHSALPAILAGVREAWRGSQPPRLVYVMSDGGALPLAFSRTVAGLREAGWLDASVTVGQAFGGDLEAVSLHSGLLAARLVLKADVVVVTQGPGNLGTGTRWGFSGVAAGEALNAAAVLGGRGIAALRVSTTDARARHRGVSHHSLTAVGRVALAPSDVVMPVVGDDVTVPGGADALRASLAQARTTLAAGRHTLVDVPADAGLLHAVRTSPVHMSTMGRDLDTDPWPFLAAAAAGVHAAHVVAVREDVR